MQENKKQKCKSNINHIYNIQIVQMPYTLCHFFHTNKWLCFTMAAQLLLTIREKQPSKWRTWKMNTSQRTHFSKIIKYLRHSTVILDQLNPFYNNQERQEKKEYRKWSLKDIINRSLLTRTISLPLLET